MQELLPLPFELASRTAESLGDLRAKTQLLSELARQQLLTGQFDAALHSFAAIPLPQDRHTALLVADFGNFPSEKIEALVQLLEASPETESLAARLALAMLESKSADSTPDAAWKLIEIADSAFESEQQRYNFLEKILTLTKAPAGQAPAGQAPAGQAPAGQAENWEKILRLYRKFATGTYRDWATLAIIKYLTAQQRNDQAEKFAGLLAMPLRQSWAYWEMSRLVPAEQSKHYFEKAAAIIEAIAITADEDVLMEMLASQLRIFGRYAFQKGWLETGERLLEQSEAAAASLALPMQRYRLQCFLGTVLVELKQIESIQKYVPIDSVLESLPSSLDRSRILVWFAEAGWHEGWSKAVEVLSVPERGVTEADRARKITEVLKRFVAHIRGERAIGDPSEDSHRSSGEEFETLYFSPFAESDCGCH